MKRCLIASAVASICVLMPSCSMFNQRVDFSWFSDTFSAPQSDVVYVEAGRGLPESSVPAAATSEVPPTAVVVNVPPAQAARQTEAPAAGPQCTHTVVKGDTLGAIARRYNSSVAAISAANQLANPDALRLGAVLVIPGGSAQVAPAQAASARQHHVAAAAPAQSAGSTQSKRKFWQFWKKKEKPAAAAAQARYYTVRRGDTLNAIARRNGVSPKALIHANRLSGAQADKLRLGQKLVIPTSKK